MVHFTGLLENARHPPAGLCRGPLSGTFVGGPCKNRVRAGIGGSPGTATGGQIHVVHISHTHPPKEIIQALRKYLLGKNYAFLSQGYTHDEFQQQNSGGKLPTTLAVATIGNYDASEYSNPFPIPGNRKGVRVPRV